MNEASLACSSSAAASVSALSSGHSVGEKDDNENEDEVPDSHAVLEESEGGCKMLEESHNEAAENEDKEVPDARPIKHVRLDRAVKAYAAAEKTQSQKMKPRKVNEGAERTHRSAQKQSMQRFDL